MQKSSWYKKKKLQVIWQLNLNAEDVDSFIKTQMSMYFCRLNTDNINPLLKEAYNVNKTLSDDRIHIWYTVAAKIFKQIDVDVIKCQHKLK